MIEFTELVTSLVGESSESTSESTENNEKILLLTYRHENNNPNTLNHEHKCFLETYFNINSSA